MPTGYTAAIKDGITFQQYAISCARAFGALIMMRDDPSDAPIPDSFEPSDHHKNALTRVQAELAELQSMSLDIANIRAANEWEASEQNRIKQLAEDDELQAKYEAMLLEAEAYQPPTPDHIEYKKFMVEQIKESIRFDCGGDYYKTPTPKLSAKEWLASAIENANHMVEYHSREHAAEVKRTNDRNAWIKALRESLA